MSDERPRNIALLIDADNASHAGLDPVLTVLAELGAVNIRRAYGNWAKPALANGWGKLIHKYGIEAKQQFDITKGKNATDMLMTIDALDLLYSGHVDGFGIMSSDSDFMPLATRLKQNGLFVYGFGSDKAPEAFQASCTRFIEIGELVKTAEDDRAKPVSDATERANGKRPINAEVIELLGTALKAAKRDEDGFASLSEVGKIAGNRSSFDARNYGFKRLSDMIGAIPNFQTEKRGNVLFVKRLR